MNHNPQVADFFALFKDSPFAYELYNHDGQLISVNIACLKLFGIDDFKYVENFNFFDDPNISKEAITKIANKEIVHYKTTFDFELVKEKQLYPTRHSGQIQLEVVINPIRIDPQSEEFFYLVQIININPQHLLEKKYRLLFEHLNSGFLYCAIIKDPKGKISDFTLLEINRHFLDKIQHRKEEVLGKRISEIFPQLAIFLSSSMIQNTLVNGTPSSTDYFCENLKRWQNINIYSPGPGEIAILMEDIHEKKIKEKFLHDKMLLLEKSLENAPSPLAIITQDGKIISCNNNFSSSLFSEDKNKYLPNFFDLLTKKSQNDFQQVLKESIKLKRSDFSYTVILENMPQPKNTAILNNSIIYQEDKVIGILLTLFINETNKKRIKTITGMKAIIKELSNSVTENHKSFKEDADTKLINTVLTDKESALLEHLLAKKSNQELASLFFVKEITVKKWLTPLYEKLGVKNRSELLKKLNLPHLYSRV